MLGTAEPEVTFINNLSSQVSELSWKRKEMCVECTAGSWKCGSGIDERVCSCREGTMKTAMADRRGIMRLCPKDWRNKGRANGTESLVPEA